jgi:hypothetical protein
MYVALVILHSWLRWVVVLTGLAAAGRSLTAGGRSWTSSDDAVAKWFTITFDIQFLIGLILYVFLSPLTQMAFADFGAAMRDSTLRFWGVEHIFGMVAASALAHVGRAKIRKAPEHRKHRTAAIFFTLALVAIALSIPWPFMPVSRPLFRLPGM